MRVLLAGALILASLAGHAMALAVEDNWLSAVCLIQNPSAEVNGTGFFVFRPVTALGGHVFLVSNKHVIHPDSANKVTTGVQLTVVFSYRQADSLASAVMPVPLYGATGGQLWYDHPEVDVDIAAIDVTAALNNISAATPAVAFGYVSENAFATRASMDSTFVSLGDPIVLLGYPLSLLDFSKPLPIARSGCFATAPTLDFRGSPSFLIDCPTLRGSSGSPVFIPVRPYKIRKVGGSTTLDGLSGYLPVLAGIAAKNIPDWELVVRRLAPFGTRNDEFTVNQTANLGLVFRAEAISETIDRSGVVRFRR